MLALTGAGTAGQSPLFLPPVERVDTDARPRVSPGLVASIDETNMRTLQALRVAVRTSPRVVAVAIERPYLVHPSQPAALAFMAGCATAPHPAMSERTSPLPRLKGSLRRAAPALDPRQRAVGKPHASLNIHHRRSCSSLRLALRHRREVGEASISGGLGKVDLPS